jgi:hypothetical protein
VLLESNLALLALLLVLSLALLVLPPSLELPLA